MKIEELKKLKTVKKAPANTERYIKVIFEEEGMRVDGNYVSGVNQVEAIIALIISVVSNNPGLEPFKDVLDAIHSRRMAREAVESIFGAIAPKCKSCKAKKATKKK